MSRVYHDHEITYVRTDQLRAGDRLASGRSLEDGGYTARTITTAGPGGHHPQWGDRDLTYVQTSQHAWRQPGDIPVAIVRREVA